MEKQYKYKLAISIITRNRKEVVEEILERLLKALYDRNIGIYFFDGSDTDELGDVIKEWQQHGFDNLYYRYYDPQVYKGIKDIERWVDARKCIEAEYIWFCSDKFVPRKKCLDQVLVELKKEYDIIVYDVMQWNGEDTKEYYDCVTFFKECAPKLQMLSVPIISQKIISMHTSENIEKIRKDCKILDTEIVFSAIANWERFYAKRLDIKDEEGMLQLLQINKNINSGHIQEKLTLPIFVERVYNTIKELPEIYDSEKEHVMMNFSCHTWFSLEGFLQLRWKKGYDYKQCLQYWNKWKLVSKVPRMIILCISVLPYTISRILYKRVCKVKKLLGLYVF